MAMYSIAMVIGTATRIISQGSDGVKVSLKAVIVAFNFILSQPNY